MSRPVTLRVASARTLCAALGLAFSLSTLAACASAPSSAPASPPATGSASASAAAPSGGGQPDGWSETEPLLRAALNGAHRPAEQKARDGARHPLETLKFFGLRRDMTVVELWPGGGAWYTAVLAPVLAEKGKLVVTNFDPANPQTAKYAKAFQAQIDKHRDVYAKMEVRTVAPPERIDLGPDGSADLVVSFRSVHGWMNRGYVDKVLAASFRVLKPGGVLGIVQHRAGPGADPATVAKTGYVPEDHVIKLAEAAGFKLAAKSEINANPRDTKDHPEGVWTLPPTLRLGAKDRAKYVAIGESDRMTLKFVKP